MTSRKKHGFAANGSIGNNFVSSDFRQRFARPVIYNVDRIIGAGSVTGFIETDGATGVLTAANFVHWNLLLFDGTSIFTLLSPLSGNNSAVFVQGADTEAFGTSFCSTSAASTTESFFSNKVCFRVIMINDCDASHPAHASSPAKLGSHQRDGWISECGPPWSYGDWHRRRHYPRASKLRSTSDWRRNRS